MAIAAAHRLAGLRQTKFLAEGAYPQDEKYVDWELEIAYRHLRVAWEPTVALWTDEGERADISETCPFLAHALDSVIHLLDTMPWNNSKRQKATEIWSYGSLLRIIGEMAQDSRTKELITPFLVSRLIAAFTNIIRREDWEDFNSTDDPDVLAGQEILKRLSSNVNHTS